ncbi:unnamed protein product [Allacma fusca]|uniref:Protein sarah n=1 Tax=Allacma fusca TaxID=39272 RepID=A0A8J2J203_9HEXA|nr:unnamed protein product [Allacma fusca]
MENGYENVFINESDGLSNKVDCGSNKENSENNGDNSRNSEEDLSDIPKSLIVTGLDMDFFDNSELKEEFESVFNQYGDCTFQYFRSFKRVRVNYNNPESSITARLNGHLLKVGECTVNVYFAIGQQVKSDKSRKSADGYLHPPTPDKQFLISPPASPPVGWEPRAEDQPNINFDLISALSQLAPGESHELYKPLSATHPSIVVHIAAAPTAAEKSLLENGFKIIQTKRPPMNTAYNKFNRGSSTHRPETLWVINSSGETKKKPHLKN